jgi:hypothetical protein
MVVGTTLMSWVPVALTTDPKKAKAAPKFCFAGAATEPRPAMHPWIWHRYEEIQWLRLSFGRWLFFSLFRQAFLAQWLFGLFLLLPPQGC